MCVQNRKLDFLGHVVTNKGLKPDQKKVTAILQMPNPTDVEAVRRLQGMIIYLGKFLPQLSSVTHIADTLFRAYLADGADSCEQFSQINALEHSPIGQSTMSLLRTAIAEDDHMQTLKQTILTGWPDNRADVNTDIASYFTMRDELAVHNGLIFRGECVIVPQGMRKYIKKRLHLPHLGADSIVRRTRLCLNVLSALHGAMLSPPLSPFN